MIKYQMVETIREHNRTAPADFLMTFKEDQLKRYLRRLTDLSGHRGRSSVWVREGETPAIVARVV